MLTSKLQVTLLTNATGTSVTAGSAAMTKLDNMNFILDMGATPSNQSITLTIKNGSESRTITVYTVLSCDEGGSSASLKQAAA